MSLNSAARTSAASSIGERAGAGTAANGNGVAAPTAAVGHAVASKPTGGRRRAVENDTGVPQCLEKLMAPAGDEDGDGGAAAGGGVLAGLLSTGCAGKMSAEWQKLADQVDPKTDCSTVQSIQFAFDYAGLPPAEILPDEVPSLGALRLLKWASESESNYGEFIKSIWSKTIPNKAEIERGGRFTDDGREQFALLDEFERHWNATQGVEAAPANQSSSPTIA
jgi:hypothetical protein